MTRLQLALDLLSLEEASRLAAMLDGVVDIVEAGTPLIKREGMAAVRSLRAAAPSALILADMKTMDAGAVEAELAFDAGADLMTVLGGASPQTLAGAIRVARDRGRQIVVDLLGVPDPVQAATAIARLDPDLLGIHSGTDERQGLAAGPLPVLKAVGRAVDLPLSVAGGITLQTLNPLLEQNPAIVVVGSSITGAIDPLDVARQFQAALRVPKRR